MLIEKYEKKIVLYVSLLFFVIQFLLVTVMPVEHFSDSLAYLKSAYSAIEAGKIYPLQDNLNDRWIAAQGWVNLIALFLVVFGTVKSVLYFNIVLNILILAELYYITRKAAGVKPAIISLLLFVLLLSNYGIVLFLYTELLFMALVLGSLCLLLQNKSKYYLISGILIGLANWIRPFAPAVVVIFIVGLIILKLPKVNFIPWIIGLLLTIIIIGGVTYLSCGQFIYSPITAGANMMYGSNPLADGSYDGVALRPGGLGYLPDESSLNVKEKDAIWKQRSVEWILNNPIAWIKLIPRKLFYLYSSEISLLHFFRDGPRQGSFADDFKGIITHFPRLSTFEWLLILNNMVYLIILSLSLISVYFVFVNKFTPGYIAFLYIFVLTGTTILAVGTDRYHYPMMPAMIFLAAYTISNIDQIRKNGKISLMA